MYVGITWRNPSSDNPIRFRFKGSGAAMAALLGKLNAADQGFQVYAEPDSELPLLSAPDPADPLPFGENPFVWNYTGQAEIYQKALAAGARQVFSPNPDLQDLHHALQSREPNESPPETGSSLREIRQYHRGERLFIEPDNVVEIMRGIVRCSSLHPDGSEVVTGFFGQGDFLFSHHAAHCHSEMTAHTPLAVSLYSHQAAMSLPHFHARLRDRLCFMEAWSAMQGRPVLADRLLGILEVLAGKFAVRHNKEWRFRMKITHEQLAGAIGARRTTVTRLLGDLRKTGKLKTSRMAGG